MAEAVVAAVTANLACGGPHTSVTIEGAREWVKAAVSEGIDLLFLQECPDGLGPILGDRYATFSHDGEKPAYRCRSILAVRRTPLLRASRYSVSTGDYHGSYLAAATIQLGTLTPLVAVSVHASPTPYDDRYRDDWPGRLPDERRVQTGQRLWDADLVLETLVRIAAQGCDVLAAGDFNEARAFDTPGNSWAEQYFAGASDSGLHDVTHQLWAGELATCGDMQDDHVLATSAIATRITHAEVVTDGPLASRESDHQPLRWSIDLEDGGSQTRRERGRRIGRPNHS